MAHLNLAHRHNESGRHDVCARQAFVQTDARVVTAQSRNHPHPGKDVEDGPV